MTQATLTVDATWQIEQALDELRYANDTDVAKTKYYKALAIIRAARAQANHIVDADKTITLTTEAAQQIEEALNAVKQMCEVAHPQFNWGASFLQADGIALLNEAPQAATKALTTIRAARAQEQPHPDDEAVDRFAAAMKAKLEKKRAEGRGGWEDKNQCSAEFLNRLLNEHVGKGDPVDVGNLAMMLWNRGERTEVVREQVQAEQEPTSKTKALDYAILTLHSIACLTQGDNLLWWQKSARNALAKIDELLREQSVATYQEPASRAILCPPPPPEVYQMRSRDAYEAGWYEAQKQKAVSPISPVQQAEQEPVAWTYEEVKSAFEYLKLQVKGPDDKWTVGESCTYFGFFRHGIDAATQRRTAPVRTKDLTDEEIDEIPFNRVSDDPLLEYARAVIAKFKEKNK